MTPASKWLLCAAWLIAAAASAAEPEPSAAELIAGVIDLTRGQTSYAEFAMVIHRPDWERSSKLIAWTRGREDALIRFTAPPHPRTGRPVRDSLWSRA